MSRTGSFVLHAFIIVMWLIHVQSMCSNSNSRKPFSFLCENCVTEIPSLSFPRGLKIWFVGACLGVWSYKISHFKDKEKTSPSITEPLWLSNCIFRSNASQSQLSPWRQSIENADSLIISNSWRTPSLIIIFVWIIVPSLGHILTFECYYYLIMI